MKKSIIASILTASLLAASIAPVYGAEFISDPAETFSAGEETPNLEAPAETEVPAASYEEDEEYLNVEMRISKPQEKTHFAYGFEVSQTNQLVLDGLQVEMVRPDGSVADIATYEYGEMYGDDYDYDYYVYIYDGEEEVSYEDAHLGEYKIVVKEVYTGTQVSFPVYVEDPKDVFSHLGKTGDGTYSVTTPFNPIGDTYAFFTPEDEGLYKLQAVAPEKTEDPMFAVRKAGKDYNDYTNVFPVGVTGALGAEGVYQLEKNQAYCLTYSDFGMNGKQMDVTFKATVLPKLIGMEWVEKPTAPLYSRLNLSGWYDEKKIIAGQFNDGKIKLIYADGTEEIIRLSEGTKYGESIENNILCGETTEPKAGTYKAEFYVHGNSDIKLTADVTIKDPATMTTIKGKGSATVPFTSPYQQYVRFVSGSGKTYKLTCNRKDDMVHIFVYDENGGFVGLTGIDNIISNLKPNKVYYLVSQGGPIEGEYKTITYTAAPAKMPLSKSTFSYSTTVTYTGKELKPTVKVTYDGIPLKKDRDYTISCSNNVKIGTATITIKGKGEYTGTVKKTFQIVPGKVSITSYKRTGNTSAKISWKSVKGAYGYVVYRATGSKWTRVGTTRSTSFTDKKIKKGIAYKYKVRAYGKSGSKNIYGSYSSVKTIKK